MADTVITRFAPSPTGFLHIGGARTALFNWLYARGHQGKMLLRIEDTDRARSTDDAIQAIIDGLKWLELDWDEDVIYQHARANAHREAVERLLAEGKAYRCYSSPEELAEMRENARRQGQPPVYDGRWRDRDPSDAPSGIRPAIRLKTPRDGETVIDDKVQGKVTIANRDLDDLVLLRSDGSPTYMLSVVVDDHEAGITHIIRGDDHLTNAARQTQIYAALGWGVPIFAHVPLIHGPDGAKLSKRHGALGVEAYREMGYLPQALRNYLVRLGWSHGDDEIISMEQMIEWFDLDAIGRSPARFDFAKLENLNGHYIRERADADLVADLKSIMPLVKQEQRFEPLPNDTQWERIEAAMPHLKERAKTLLDLVDGARFLVAERPLSLEEKARAIIEDGGRATLSGLLPALEGVASWEADAIEAAIRDYAVSTGLKLGQVAQPLRAALTGRATSPGIFDVLVLLGRDESLARLKDQAKLT